MKVALVLSGGGAKGAFQVMAEKYAREIKGYKWDVIAGVSVGALNGTLLAMEKYQRLEEIWRTISSDQVYTGGMNVWSIVKLIFGAKSIYGNRPLWELLDREIDPDKVKTDLRIGVVSLRTGEYVRFRPSDPGFKRAVLASTAIPLIWAPVDISPLRQENALDIGKLALEVALNEIFTTDVREFIRINRNVEEAAAQGVTLHNETGKPFKYYKCAIIEPDEPLGDTLDFSRAVIQRRMEAGWEKAKEVLG